MERPATLAVLVIKDILNPAVEGTLSDLGQICARRHVPLLRQTLWPQLKIYRTSTCTLQVIILLGLARAGLCGTSHEMSLPMTKQACRCHDIQLTIRRAERGAYCSS